MGFLPHQENERYFEEISSVNKFEVLISLIIAYGVGYLAYTLHYKAFLGVSLVVFLLIYSLINTRQAIYLVLFLLPLRLFLFGAPVVYGIPFDAAALLNLYIPFWAVAYVLLRRKTGSIDAVGITYFIFVVICGISVLYTDDKLNALKYLLRLSTPMCFYIIVKSELDEYGMNDTIFRVICLSLVVPLCFSIFQILNPALLGETSRISGTFGHPNPFSFLLLLVWIILCVRTFDAAAKNRKMLYFLATGVITVFIILTYCRITWIGLFASFFLISIHYRKMIPFAGFVAAGVFLFIFNLFSVQDRVSSAVLFAQRGDLYSLESSIGWRFVVWDMTFREIIESPLWGYGLRSHFSILRSLYGQATSVHNSYLEILYDVGLIGFSVFMTFIFFLMRTYMRLAQTIRSGLDRRNTKRLVVTFGALLVSYVIILVSDNLLEYYEISIYYWTVFAVAQKLYLSAKADEN